jgi:hypothetical protein
VSGLKMKVKELVGKQAIRTAPVSYGNGNNDYSYTHEPLFILKVTNSHIVYTQKEGFFKDKVHILDGRWNDNNWADYDELINLDHQEAVETTTKGNAPKVVAIH